MTHRWKISKIYYLCENKWIWRDPVKRKNVPSGLLKKKLVANSKNWIMYEFHLTKTCLNVSLGYRLRVYKRWPYTSRTLNSKKEGAVNTTTKRINRINCFVSILNGNVIFHTIWHSERIPNLLWAHNCYSSLIIYLSKVTIIFIKKRLTTFVTNFKL